MIKTENLTKIYRTEDVETTALNEISIDIKEAEFVAFLGPSGCGKSTMLNVIGMLDDFDAGTYAFNGRAMSSYQSKEKAEIRRRQIGFIFQSFNLIDELTVYENIELPLRYLRLPSTERRRKVDVLLERMQLTARRDHFPRQLSGGQQQRVAVARATVADPKLVLADEPTGNLDSVNGNEVINLLTELNREGTAVLMVTHSNEYAQKAGRILHMLDGKIVAENRPGGRNDK